MNAKTIAVVWERAAGLSRRGSFRLLGGAALGGSLAAPAIASTAKSGKNGQKRCKRQRGQCLAFVEEYCQPKGDPNACEAQFNPCCEPFAQCKAGEGIECLFDMLLGAGGG